MPKALKVFIHILIGFFALAFLWLVFFNVAVNNGLIQKWNGKWYTSGQLKKAFPPQEYSVESKNTPEEVYAQFRAALLANDLEAALGFMTEGSRGRYREAFVKNGLKKLGETYPERVNKDHERGNLASYNYTFIKDGKKINSSIEFIKSPQGYWQIDQI